MNKTYLDKKGYLRWKDSNRLVHRTTAYKHIYLKNRDKCPLPFSKYQIHHIDGNKKNNRISNLKLVSRKGHDNVHRLSNEGWGMLVLVALFILAVRIFPDYMLINIFLFAVFVIALFCYMHFVKLK